MIDQNDQLQPICEAFGLEGTIVACKALKGGNINRTWRLDLRHQDGTQAVYILQRINTYVFRQPVQVMENIDRVTAHIRAKEPDGVGLRVYRTREGKPYLEEQDEQGGDPHFWRVFNFIPSTTYDSCLDPAVLYNGGKAFGAFQMALSDFDASLLHETIPDFHNTRKRYETFEACIASTPEEKLAEVAEEVSWFLSVKEKACTLADLHAQGVLPLRVTHNDTKINNVLFEQGGSRALTVVDLDTVMPGLVGADFGDAIRGCCNRVPEDHPNAQEAGMDLDIYRAFTEGFLSETASVLTPAELDTLAIGAFTIAVELASRFLIDHLQGNLYFHVDYPTHNLVRARCQIALAKDMLEKMDQMEQIIRDCVASCR